MTLLEREPLLDALEAALREAAGGAGRDRKRTFCVYDAPTPEAIRQVAGRNKLPIERITEVRVLTPYFHR